MRRVHKEYDTPARTDVEAAVAAFLDVPQHVSRRGGFADVAKDDAEELSRLIELLVKFRYAPDADGDRPVLWDLCDWTAAQPQAVTHLPKLNEDNSNIDDILYFAIQNMLSAAEEVRRWQNLKLYYSKLQK